MEKKKEKCLLIPEGMAKRLGEELKDVYAPKAAAAESASVPVPAGKLSKAELKRYAEITAERSCLEREQKDAKTFSVSVKFPVEDRELISKAIKACGYGGVSDWVRTCYKRLLLRQIAIMRGKEEK